MSEAPGSSRVEVRRAWQYEDEDEGMLHIELAAGDATLDVHLKAARNPRMFEFIMKNAEVTTRARPAEEAKNQQ